MMGRAQRARGVALLSLALAGTAASAQREPALPLEAPELEGAIAGRVCEDRNHDGACQDDEPGIAGARVLLETGQQAIADTRGRYHLAAVPGRASDRLAGGRLLPGRHRVRLDERALPPGTVARPVAVVIEVPMAGLVTQDFAVEAPLEKLGVNGSGGEPSSAHDAQPPAGELAGPAVRFLVTGRAAPGDRVTVQGLEVEIDAAGDYRAWVSLAPGPNDLFISATSPAGAVRLSVQRIDVVERRGSVLVVPREIEPTATVQLPVGPSEQASTGRSVLRLRGAPGTRVRHPGGELVVGADGLAVIPIELGAGTNRLELEIHRPGQPVRVERLEIRATPRPLVVGLLDLELAVEPARLGHTVTLFGRGAAHFEHRLRGWELAGELDLRDQDWRDLRVAGVRMLAAPRRPDRLERALDPEDYPIEWGDESLTISPNFPEGRLRFEARHEGFGRVGFGTHRALFHDAEVGRYQRALFGPYLDLRTPPGKVQGGLSGFFAPGLADPTRALSLQSAHEELTATGGSLYWLGHSAVARGSELVRVELRDGLTGLPLGERHLQRGRDYEIDYAGGRLALARPLSFLAGQGPLAAEPLTAGAEQVLVVDYEHVQLLGSPRVVAGGEVSGKLGPASLSVGAVREDSGADGLTLLRASVRAPLGPVTLLAEAAQSDGRAIRAESFGLSDDGGLWFLRPRDGDASGQALTLRLRGPGFGKGGNFDVAFRRRTPGFSDGAHFDSVGLRQLSLRGEQPIGRFVLGALADDRVAVDPRVPFSDVAISARTLGLSGGWRAERWGLSLDVKDSSLTAAPDPLADEPATGGRTSAGLSGHYRVSESLRLLASHKQALLRRGEGLGAVDDSFSSVGLDLRLDEDAEVGLRGGWGPVLGPQVWGHGSKRSGGELWYGTYSVDVDGPDFGARRTTTGARTDAGDGLAVFVEDVASHDATSLRMSRAVGLTQEVATGFEVSGRYERGVRHPLDVAPTLRRDAGGVTASLLRQRGRAFLKAEVRSERGAAIRGPPVAVDRLQQVYGLGGEVSLLESLSASMRASLVHSVNAGRLEARLLEGSAGLAWRARSGALILRYSLERELAPPARGGFSEKSLGVLSLMPSVRLGSRFGLAAGAHAGWDTRDGNTRLVLSGSVRPSVRVVGGLELAGEVARRSEAPDDGELTALRGEVGYRFDERMMIAAGYSLLGFRGLGLSDGSADRRDRAYLRAEFGF